MIEQKFTDGSPKVISVYKNDKIIKQTEYYENKQLKIAGEFDDAGKRQGHWQYWHEDGKIWSECDYNHGVIHGNNTVYYENGNKRFSGEYEEGKKIGIWLFWNEDGTINTEREF